MRQVNIGDSSSAAPNLVSVSVTPPATVNVAHVAGASLSYFTNGLNAPATALTVGNNVNFSLPTWLQVTGGIATVRITGGKYGP